MSNQSNPLLEAVGIGSQAYTMDKELNFGDKYSKLTIDLPYVSSTGGQSFRMGILGFFGILFFIVSMISFFGEIKNINNYRLIVFINEHNISIGSILFIVSIVFLIIYSIEYINKYVPQYNTFIERCNKTKDCMTDLSKLRNIENVNSYVQLATSA